MYEHIEKVRREVKKGERDGEERSREQLGVIKDVNGKVNGVVDEVARLREQVMETKQSSSSKNRYQENPPPSVPPDSALIDSLAL